MELKVNVITPETTIYEGLAKSVTAFNEKGKFSVLPEHTNFISVILDKVIISGFDGKKEISFNKGVVMCREDQIDVYIETAN